MTDEQTANVVKAINDTLTENKATLGDAIWILSGMAVRFIETTADKSAPTTSSKWNWRRQ